jgi:hypothetical protein
MSEYPTKEQLHRMLNNADAEFNRLVDVVNVFLKACSDLDLTAMGEWMDEYATGPEGYGPKTKPCSLNWRKIIGKEPKEPL